MINEKNRFKKLTDAQMDLVRELRDPHKKIIVSGEPGAEEYSLYDGDSLVRKLNTPTVMFLLMNNFLSTRDPEMKVLKLADSAK